MHMSKANQALDIEIGRRVRAARLRAGASQEALASAIGCTFQQVQKYEAGRNRIAVSTLLRVATALGSSTESLLSDLSAAGGDTSAPITDRQAMRCARLVEALPATTRPSAVRVLEAIAAAVVEERPVATFPEAAE